MTTPAQRALDLARDAKGEIDEDRFERELKLQIAKREKQLRSNAQATSRAMEGWPMVKDQEEWLDTVDKADADFHSGVFLIDRLGAERHVDPIMTAVILNLRTQLINEHEATTAAELMIIDVTLLSYYNLFRVNGWIGDIGQELENEFFGRRPLSAKLKDNYGTGEVRGLRVEDIVKQLTQNLAPVYERMNRMMLRNLAALKTWRQPPTPSVSVERAGQVNVGKQQINIAQDHDDVKSLGD